MQGRDGDWHEEAPKMAAIYMNASLTIAAVDGTQLADIPSTQKVLLNPNKFANPRGEWNNLEFVYRALSDSGNFASRQEGELDTRGWAFQEKMLSRRVISLTKNGIFWDCLHHSASGSRPCGILGDFSPNFRDSDDRAFKRMLLCRQPATGSLDDLDPYWYWRQAVQDYTKRSLTRGTDRLIALLGVIKQMSTILQDDCQLGIWKNEIMRSLIWFVDPSDYPAKLSEPAVTAPSWSWISVDGPVSYRLWHPHSRYVQFKSERLDPVAVFRHLTVENLDEFQFSRFKGLMRLRGPVVEGSVISDKLFIRKTPNLPPQSPESRERIEETRGIRQPSLISELYEDQSRDYHERKFFHALLLRDPRPFVHEKVKIEINAGSVRRINNHSGGEAGLVVLPRPTLEVDKPRLVKCMLLCEGGYSTPLKAQYCMVLEAVPSEERNGVASWWGYSSAVQYRRIGLTVIDLKELCLFSSDTCSTRDEAGHRCLGWEQLLEIV